MLAVVVSRADSASEHVGEHLLDLCDWTEHTDNTRSDADGGGTVYRTPETELRAFDALHLETTDVGEAFGRVDGAGSGTDPAERTPTLLVFASRHAGETGALLTAHHTGNFGPAEFGGADGALARACPGAQKRVLESLREHAPPGYDVGLECTHHGPSSVGVPSMFVELGSGEEQWSDPAGARAVAKAILDLEGVPADVPPETTGDGRRESAGDGRSDPPDRRHLVGFGGSHYTPRFERLVRETDWAVGHVAADWALDEMDDPREHRDVLRAAFEQSAATRAVVEGDATVEAVESVEDAPSAESAEDDERAESADADATAESAADAAAVETVVRDLGYRVVSETWVRETDGVPLPVVDVLEDAVRPVEDGLRFGGGAADAPVGEAVRDDAFKTVSLPAELLAEAQGIDGAAARAAVEDATVAFETTENGARAEGRAAVLASEDRADLVDDLVAVLDERYETVERRDDAVVARETAFDPDRARTLGIPEGPKFGRLSAGQSVEVDGRTIDPETVHVEREHRFSLDRAE